jgi:hypothetical protein
MTRRGLALLAFAALAGSGNALAQTGPGVLVVTLADGSSVPLSSWSMSYEYQATKAGEQAGFAQPVRRGSVELWVNKKTFPMASTTLEIKYRVYQQQVEVDGQKQAAPGAVITGLVVTSAGKRSEMKLEPPAKELLMPEGSKGLLVQARSLDIRGETLTGTKRDFCAISYSALVECGAAPAERVVKVELQR